MKSKSKQLNKIKEGKTINRQYNQCQHIQFKQPIARKQKQELSKSGKV